MVGNYDIFDRSYGWGPKNTVTSETVTTAIDSSGTVTTGSKTCGDVGGNNVDNPYGAPAFFGSAYSVSVATHDTGIQASTGYPTTDASTGVVKDNITVTGALTNVGVVGDGVFDRTWGNGDQDAGYRGKAGAVSQAALFSSATSNFTTPGNTDSGATAPKYFEVSPGNGTRPAPSADFSSLQDRSSGYGHTTGGSVTVVWNGVNQSVPALHD